MISVHITHRSDIKVSAWAKTVSIFDPSLPGAYALANTGNKFARVTSSWVDNNSAGMNTLIRDGELIPVEKGFTLTSLSTTGTMTGDDMVIGVVLRQDGSDVAKLAVALPNPSSYPGGMSPAVDSRVACNDR